MPPHAEAHANGGQRHNPRNVRTQTSAQSILIPGQQALPQDTAAWAGAMPEMMQWPMAGQPTNSAALADAYGATHGQPQSGVPGMEWYGGTSPAMYADQMNQSPFVAPVPYNPLQGSPAASAPHAATAANLAQQLNALHLQNQQNEQIVAQQNKLLAQIQAAQEMRAQAEAEASNTLLQQQANTLAQFAQTHQIPRDLHVNPRHGMIGRQNKPADLTSPNARFPSGAASTPNRNRFSAQSTPQGAPFSPTQERDQRRSRQLPPDVSKAMEAMNVIRQQHGDQDASDSSFTQSPRPSSYGGRDRTRESGTWGQSGQRAESRRTSTMQRNEKTYGVDLPGQRAVTPSIVIGSGDADGASSLPLLADVHAVGMRIGSRTTPGMHDASPSAGARYSDLSHSEELRPGPGNRHSMNQDKKRQSFSELGVGKPSRHTDAGPRPSSVANPTPLIQPRRQPRGPPMDSFFAANFLARRSLRTRRQAMSKLCASPRAASFSSSKNATQAAPSPLGNAPEKTE